MDAPAIVGMLETDFERGGGLSNHALQHVVRLLDEASPDAKLSVLAEAIVLLLQYTDLRKREALVAGLDGALKRSGHCLAFESVFRTTEYELFSDDMLLRPEDMGDGVDK